MLPCLRLIDFNAQKLRVVYYFRFSQHRIDRTSEDYRSIYTYTLVFRKTDEIERETADFWIMLVPTGIHFSSYYKRPTDGNTLDDRTTSNSIESVVA